ncbi:MAG: hypothetical protein E7195_10150 [Peptococcaceae bacterium]|nr:hypothetical protein [Peptococcaceae bacterium]
MRRMTIYVQNYKDRNIEGVLYAPECGIVEEFCNLTQLLFQMDDLLYTSVRRGTAQSCRRQLKRRILSPWPGRTGNSSLMATFEVREFCRKGYSWQGRIRWVNQDEEYSFRSTLEFVKLLDSALGS